MPSRATFSSLSLPGTQQSCHVGGGGFNFTQHMRTLCVDLVSKLSELSHIDMRRVAISFSQARKRVKHGLFATTTPMRFEDGAVEGMRHGRPYAVQQLFDSDGLEMLYIISFYLPRFMDVDFKEKLATIVHELWHISPDFNGDLRRFPGRCYAHTHSQKEYDDQMAALTDRYLALSPRAEQVAFLHNDFDALQTAFGRVYGTKIPHPKLIPLS